MGNTSLGGTGVPVSSSNPLASIPQTHQFASSAPQGVPASSLDVDQAVKQEPSPSPAPLVEEVLDTSSRPSKASKMPSKTPARASKRRLSTSTNQSSGQAATDPQRRSTRQKTGKA